ncbi:hypothetical protein OOT33_00575 [Sphingobium sp. DEHP117]|uniref:hypothetical protein n=1 Tax=Sphingobium sp. DEHP117 TaxID=2993436 RepID=UPI0027D7177B|nr:hypothetical protein [Sphingobium sp. DEHP117]MDQ4418941.1 hypothetical protein [Sphingobium sp. DEHP117]
MSDPLSDTPRRGKGHPPSPYQLERLAVATTLVNQGWSFTDAAEAGVTFLKLDLATKSYVLDEEANALMPQKKARRRVALYEIKRRYAEEAKQLGVPMPLAFRSETQLKSGRPKKKRSS